MRNTLHSFPSGSGCLHLFSHDIAFIKVWQTFTDDRLRREVGP